MQKKRLLTALARTSLITVIVLNVVFLLILFAWANFSTDNLMNQVGLQRARSQRIAKDVLILSTHPTDESRAQAISEMQNMLPGWQETQTGLQQGDPALGLPHAVPDNIQLILTQAQPDYNAMLVAAKAILASPDKPVNSIQVTIILAHELKYYLAMSQVETLWQQQIDAWRWQFFWTASVVLVLIMVLIVLTYSQLTMRAMKQIPVLSQESQKEEQNL